MIDRACEVLNVKADELSEFSATDSFNVNNIISGFICR